jgi:hypothetical protein
MFDPATVKTLVVAAFNGGIIWGSIKAGNRKQREEVASLKRRINRLRRYKEWSHRAITLILNTHRLHHPQDQHLIDDWKDNGQGEDENGV